MWKLSRRERRAELSLWRRISFPFFLTRRLIKYYKGFQVFLSEYVKGAFPTEENRTSLNRRLEPGKKKKKKNPVDVELLYLVKKNL